MPKKDFYHQSVRVALEKDNWTITDDPLTVPTPNLEYHIDLGAIRDVFGATKNGEEIAVEVKSLKGNSVFYDFHQALGQFMMYRLALKVAVMPHFLFLAIPTSEFKRLKKAAIYPLAWKEYQVNLLIFNEKTQKIVKWIRH